MRKRLLTGPMKDRLIQQNVNSNNLAQNILLTMASEASVHHINFSNEVANDLIPSSEPGLPYPLLCNLASYAWNIYRRMSIVLFTATRTSTLKHVCFYNDKF